MGAMVHSSAAVSLRRSSFDRCSSGSSSKAELSDDAPNDGVRSRFLDRERGADALPVDGAAGDAEAETVTDETALTFGDSVAGDGEGDDGAEIAAALPGVAADAATSAANCVAASRRFLRALVRFINA